MSVPESQDPYEIGVTDERNLALRRSSGRINDKRATVSFLYELMRDHLPAGTVEELVRRNEMVSESNEAQFTNGHLAQYAQHLADRLGL